MLTCIPCSSLEKIFPDKAPDPAGFAGFSLLQGEYGAFQIALQSDEPVTLDIQIESALDVRAFRVDCVPVALPCHEGDDDYLRKTPGLYPDVLVPCETITLDTQVRALWFEIAAGDYAGGEYPVSVTLGDTTCTVQVTVIPAALPAQTLLCTHWLHTDCLHTWYGVEVFSEEYWRITENYVRAAVRHGVNFILTPLFTPPLDTAVGKERPTVQLVDVVKTGETYTFGFEKLRRWFDMCERCGVAAYEMSHLFTQWGAMHAPKIVATVDGETRQIFGWKTWAASKKYEAFLRAFGAALRSFLQETGMLGRCYFHVSDEPSMDRIRAYARRSRLIHEIFPDSPVIDALSDIEFYQRGLLPQPIPCVNHAAEFYGRVPQLWTYYCCGPESGHYPNRLMAMPSHRNRVLGMLMYRFDVRGFLQWGLNFWYSPLSDHPVDPYNPAAEEDAFPAGDACVLYPGEGGEPVVSLRFKVFREALQDQRALSLLESRIGRENVCAMLEEAGVRAFNDYPRSGAAILALRERINRAIAQTPQVKA